MTLQLKVVQLRWSLPSHAVDAAAVGHPAAVGAVLRVARDLRQEVKNALNLVVQEDLATGILNGFRNISDTVQNPCMK